MLSEHLECSNLVAIMHDSTRFWHRNKLKNIMYTCIILHNMIVEDEENEITNWNDDDEKPIIPVSISSIKEFQNYL